MKVWTILGTVMMVGALNVFGQNVAGEPDAARVDVSAKTPRGFRGVNTTDIEKAEPGRLSDMDMPGLDNKVNLTSLDPMDVVQVINFLARRGDLKNIVIGEGVAGLTTKLKFDDVSVRDAMEVVLSVNNLAYEIEGGIIKIMTDEKYKSLYGTGFYDNKRVRIVELAYADPTRVSKMLESLKSSIGTIVSDPVTGTLILIDTPEKIQEMQTVIDKTDISTISRVLPTETRSFRLQYADVETLKTEVEAVISKDAGSVRFDKRTRTLLVTDLPHTMKKVENLVSTFDTAPRQVFIEAKIVEVSLSDEYSLGIEWKHLFEGVDPRFSLQSASAPGSSSSPAGTLSYNTIVGGGDLQVVLKALKTVGETKVLSNPHVAVLDGEEATIQVVEEQPYKERQFESGTTNVTGETYYFKDVGVELSVTPRINELNFINMAIKPEISTISAWYDGAPQEGTPVIKKSMAQTTVMIKDGVTLIIGGMIKNRTDTSKQSVPVFGAIPLLGALFRYDAESSANTETVVFLTPRVVSGEEPYLRMKDIKKAPKPLRPVRADIKGLKGMK